MLVMKSMVFKANFEKKPHQYQLEQLVLNFYFQNAIYIYLTSDMQKSAFLTLPLASLGQRNNTY